MAEKLPHKREEVCAVIVTYNPGSGVVSTYRSIVGQVSRIIIVDNGSDDATLDVLRKLQFGQPEVTELILNRTNIGVASALNQGVERAVALGFPWVLTMDHDSVADPNMVENLIRCWTEHPERNLVKIVAARYFDINSDFLPHFPIYKGLWPKLRIFTPQESVIETMDIITSGNLVRVDVFRDVGFFNEELFIDAVDIEFCMRLANAGYKIVVSRDALLKHQLGNATTGSILGRKIITLNHSPLRRYYIARNRIYTIKRFFLEYPSFGFFFIREFFFDFLRILLIEDSKGMKLSMIFRGILDGVKGRMGKMH
jgi:rhamnosyltransferase